MIVSVGVPNTKVPHLKQFVTSIFPQANAEPEILHTVPNVQGYWFWRLFANWSSADMPTGLVFTVFRLRYDANNEWSLAYTVGTGLVFKARSAGVSYAPTVLFGIVVDTKYDFLLRWTSALGEWDKPLTLTLVARDTATQAVLGSAELPYAPPVFNAGARLGILCDPDTADTQWDGYLVETKLLPIALPSDEEMGL